MAKSRRGYYIHLNELAGASLLPVCALYFEYERVAYCSLALVALPFLLRYQERQALREGRALEWVMFLMPFFMVGVFNLAIIDLQIKFLILITLWFAVTTFSVVVMLKNKQA